MAYGLFKKAKSRKLSKDVNASSVKAAVRSAKKLNSDFNQAKTHKGKLTVFHATLQEANRLGVIRKRAVHAKVKRSLKRREGIFRAAYRKMGRKL